MCVCVRACVYIYIYIYIFFFFFFFFNFLKILFLSFFIYFKYLCVCVCEQLKNTAGFMAILLTTMAGYVVASEAVLYRHSPFSLNRLFHLPWTAFWNVFGEVESFDVEGKKGLVHETLSPEHTLR